MTQPGRPVRRVTLVRPRAQGCLADPPGPGAIRAGARGARPRSGALRTPLARTSPVAGRNRVSSLAVPPRMYSCGLAPRASAGPPGLTWLRNGLVRASLILAPHGNTYRFSDLIGQLDEPLFTSVFGSTTVTTPALRLRWAVPVGHHVRVRWYELPASCSTRRMVLVPSCGKACSAQRPLQGCSTTSSPFHPPDGPVHAALSPPCVRGRWRRRSAGGHGRWRSGRPPDRDG